MTSLSYFSHVPEVRFFVSNSLFDVEFVNKKNCIFSFFIFSKFAETKHDTSNDQLWPDQLVLQQAFLVLLVGCRPYPDEAAGTPPTAARRPPPPLPRRPPSFPCARRSPSRRWDEGPRGRRPASRVARKRVAVSDSARRPAHIPTGAFLLAPHWFDWVEIAPCETS